MRLKAFSLLVILFLLLCCDQNKYLDLDYESFDQTVGSGWRRIQEEKGHIEARKAIDRYQKKHKDLDVSAKVNLSFHAGQMYAFANNYDMALDRFKNAKYPELEEIPEEARAFLFQWNAYVNATAAFLKKDKKSLLECRKKMVQGPKTNGVILNLDVVDSLISNFDKPYAEAYSRKFN